MTSSFRLSITLSLVHLLALASPAARAQAEPAAPVVEELPEIQLPALASIIGEEGGSDPEETLPMTLPVWADPNDCSQYYRVIAKQMRRKILIRLPVVVASAAAFGAVGAGGLAVAGLGETVAGLLGAESALAVTIGKVGTKIAIAGFSATGATLVPTVFRIGERVALDSFRIRNLLEDAENVVSGQPAESRQLGRFMRKLDGSPSQELVARILVAANSPRERIFCHTSETLYDYREIHQYVNRVLSFQ